MGSLMYEDLCKIILQRLDHKYTIGDFTPIEGQNQFSYSFHVDLATNLTDVQKFQLEKYVLHTLGERGFQNTVFSIKPVKATHPLQAHTCIKRKWHKHDNHTCPTYYFSVVSPVIDILAFSITGTAAQFQKTFKNTTPRSHKVEMVLTNQRDVVDMDSS